MEEQYPGLSPAGVAYQKIRRICADQDVFDDLAFTTLKELRGVLASCGSIEEVVHMYLWRGKRDATAPKDPAEARLWLQIIPDGDSGDEYGATLPVDPAAVDFGLVLPEPLDAEALAAGCRILLGLLESAEPADNFPTESREVYIDTLNDVIDEFFDDDDEDDDYYPNEMDLQRYAAQSGFTSIRFGFMPADDYTAFFTAVTMTTHAGEKHFFAWDEPGEGGGSRFVIKVDGAEYRTSTPMPVMPSLPSVVGFSPEELDRTVKDIHTIHLFARAAHTERTEGFVHELTDALSMAADSALAGNEPVPLDFFLHDHSEAGEGSEHDEGHLSGEAWHDLLQEFTRLCRLGLFGGVVVEESAVGPSLTVRARTFDPVAQQKVELQTFWKHGEDGEAEHWLAADQATCPAHDVDPMYPELLAGFALDSRDHIRHAITHLHDLSDLAGLIIEAKVNEMDELFEILDADNPDADVPDAVLGQMRADAIEDALAAMNGIAGIYTGPSGAHIRDT